MKLIGSDYSQDDRLLLQLVIFKSIPAEKKRNTDPNANPIFLTLAGLHSWSQNTDRQCQTSSIYNLYQNSRNTRVENQNEFVNKKTRFDLLGEIAR